MTSETTIANLALPDVGVNRISALTDSSKAARAVNACYEVLRRGELQAHRWKFAIERVELPKDASDPNFGKDHRYKLPADFLRLLPVYPEDHAEPPGWIIEGRYIVTNDDSPIKIRYIKDVTDVNQMDPLFQTALAKRIAHHVCEELTQSNTKRRLLWNEYLQYIERAKKVDSIEKPPQEAATDPWIGVRETNRDYSKGWG